MKNRDQLAFLLVLLVTPTILANYYAAEKVLEKDNRAVTIGATVDFPTNTSSSYYTHSPGDFFIVLVVSQILGPLFAIVGASASTHILCTPYNIAVEWFHYASAWIVIVCFLRPAWIFFVMFYISPGPMAEDTPASVFYRLVSFTYDLGCSTVGAPLVTIACMTIAHLAHGCSKLLF